MDKCDKNECLYDTDQFDLSKFDISEEDEEDCYCYQDECGFYY